MLRWKANDREEIAKGLEKIVAEGGIIERLEQIDSKWDFLSSENISAAFKVAN